MKIVSIYVLVVLLAVALSGCGKEEVAPIATTASQEQGSFSGDSENIGANNEDIEVEKSPLFTSDNMDTFLDEITNNFTNSEGDSGESTLNGTTSSTSKMIPVPVLQSTEFTLYLAESLENSYQYHYEPIGGYSLPCIVPSEGITVTVSDGSYTFESIVAQFNLTPEGEIAYDADRNTWFIDSYNVLVFVRFPDTIIVNDSSEIFDYIQFEYYSVSGDSSITNDVQ